ncbi:trypsin-like peptidase domain-containing protein [Porphyromonas sp.]
MSLLRSLCFPLVMLLSLLPQSVWGQYRTVRTPRSEQMHLTPVVQASSSDQMMRSVKETLRIAAPTADELREVARTDKGFRTYTFAVERPVTVPTASLGEVLEDGAGHYVWRATLQAPEAKNIGLRLSRYALPRGGALFVTAKGRPAKGAFTEQNNAKDSLLQIAPIDGEELLLEYEYPEGTHADQLALPFQLDALFYGFRDFRATESGFAQPGEPFYDHTNIPLSSLSCAPNVLAHPEVWKQSRSVVLLIVGGTSASTGALINNSRSDGTPYVLTSAHCLNNLFRLLGDLTSIHRNAATTVFFFGFQSPLREGNVRPTEEQSLSGANLVGYSETSEMCLLRITGLPRRTDGSLGTIPASYQPYFAGWSREEAPKGPYIGIHHPGGSTKRYSRSKDIQLQTEDYELDYTDRQGRSQIVSWTNMHWSLKEWAVGTTAAGSSGSPLFDQNGQIIGALTGGASTCDSPFEDRYWALKRAWKDASPGAGSIRSLQPWLDPTNTDLMTCPAYDPLEPKVVQRLSALYPDPVQPTLEAVKPNVLYTPKAGVDALANELQLPQLSDATVLGAYVVFKSTRELRRTSLPQVRITLQPFSGSYDLGGSVVDFASSTLGSFARYDAYGSPAVGRRTLRTDSIEVFVPAPEGLRLSLSAGRYLLSCATADGGELKLPLLAHNGSADRLRGWAAWTHHITDGWRRSAELPGGAYWIDLLVETKAPIIQPSSSGLTETLSGYYHTGTLYLEGETLRHSPCQVRIYDLMGQLHREETLAPSGGRSTLSLSGLLPGLYIAEVIPLTCPEIAHHTIYFSHK